MVYILLWHILQTDLLRSATLRGPRFPGQCHIEDLGPTEGVLDHAPGVECSGCRNAKRQFPFGGSECTAWNSTCRRRTALRQSAQTFFLMRQQEPTVQPCNCRTASHSLVPWSFKQEKLQNNTGFGIIQHDVERTTKSTMPQSELPRFSRARKPHHERVKMEN